MGVIKWKNGVVADAEKVHSIIEKRAVCCIELAKAIFEAAGAAYFDEEVEKMAIELMGEWNIAERNHEYLSKHGRLCRPFVWKLAHVLDVDERMSNVVWDAFEATPGKQRGSSETNLSPSRKRRDSSSFPVFVECEGCDGKGRYVGATTVEDPCKKCGGSGKVRFYSSDQ